MLLPDNFFYFIALFAVSMFGGTYLLFSYYRNRLLILNALMFFFCAIRACTEYYLPQVDSFETATNIAQFHGPVLLVVSFLLWYCAWFYIRPFKDSEKEKLINQVYLWGLLIIPFIFKVTWIIQRKIFFFNTEKLDLQ